MTKYEMIHNLLSNILSEELERGYVSKQLFEAIKHGSFLTVDGMDIVKASHTAINYSSVDPSGRAIILYYSKKVRQHFREYQNLPY